MSLINIFLLLHIFFSIFCTITTLPVTSKPIENTPEHLAWEAWIMVPSSNDKSRKITPKSIFIVPNGVNGNGLNTGNSGNEKNGSNLVLQCPPGHTVDNFKCIPTVNIDQSQILITRLTNLVHSTDKYNGSNDDLNENYDYDYEYDTFKADESQSFTLNNNNGNKNVFSSTSSDYSSEPLKINLSLEKFPLVKTDVKENVNNKTQNVEENNENTSVENMFTENLNTSNIVENVKNNKTNETFNDEENENNNITTSPIIHSEINDFPIISKFSSNFSETNNNATNVVLLLNSSGTEIPIEVIKNRSSTTTNNIQNLDLDDEQTHIKTTTENEIELSTNAGVKNDALQDEIEYDSLILEEINSKTTSVIDDNTETKLQIFSTTPLNEDIDDSNTNSAFVQDTFSQDNSTILESSNNSAIATKELPITMENSFLNSSNEQQSNKSTKIDYDVSPPIEIINNNSNRFLYHYLDTSNLSSNHKPYQKVQTDASEQLRVINKIVEENKKKIETIQQATTTTTTEQQQQQQQFNSKIKFPENVQSHINSNYNYHHNHNTDENLHSDYVKFPKDTASSLSRIPPILHKPLQSDPLYTSNRFLQTSSIQQPFIKPSVISPSINTGNINNNFQQNTKPFWWLPTGWEVDRTGDRPMMVRFWSRIPIEPISSSNNYHQIQTSPSIITTTNRYRENSRSPTENLYRQETLTQDRQQQNLQQQQQFHHQEHQQDIYSIKRTKQWKHNDR